MMGIWRYFYLVFTSAFLLVVGGSTAEGCICKRLHPQQQYCQAAYSIGGKIMNRQYIRIDTQPSDDMDQIVTKPHQEPDGLATMSPVTMTTMDVTTALPDVKDTENQTGVVPAFLAGEVNDDTQGDEPRPILYVQGAMELYNYNIIYTIKLSHIYKTSENEDGWHIGKDVKIQSPATTELCGMATMKKGKNYLITGKISGRVSICDWVQEHHKLTTRQKQGLKSVYGKYCDACQISVCPSRHCKKPKENRRKTCMYDASLVEVGSYNVRDCLAAHSRCTLRGGRKCKWQKNSEYNDCMNSLP